MENLKDEVDNAINNWFFGSLIKKSQWFFGSLTKKYQSSVVFDSKTKEACKYQQKVAEDIISVLGVELMQ